jgi:uridylate kinase
MKATRVDGVYSADPEQDSAATLYHHLTYREVRDKNLRVMDSTAIAQCMEHDLPILVFNYRLDGNIERAVRGEDIGTLISSKKKDETTKTATTANS